MSSSEAQAHNTRRLARSFTPQTPKHHPLLDPELPEEDIPLVPQDLSPRGQLQWELPKKARTNLHVMLKLSNKTDELMDEFHDKIPYIDEVLHEWAEMRGASPTREGREQMRAQSMHPETDDNYRSGANDDYVFNMVRNLDSPGRADVIYLTDAVEDEGSDDRSISSIPANLRGGDWSPLSPLSPSKHSSCDLPEPLNVRKRERSDSTPSNLQTSEWSSTQETVLTPTVYHPELDSESEESPKPFDEFWRDHQVPFGPQVVLGNDDSTRSSQTPSQDAIHLMVPAQTYNTPFER